MIRMCKFPKNDIFTLLYKQIRPMSIVSYSVSHFYRIIPQIPLIRFAIRADVQDVHKSIPFYSEYGYPAH